MNIWKRYGYDTEIPWWSVKKSSRLRNGFISFYMERRDGEATGCSSGSHELKNIGEGLLKAAMKIDRKRPLPCPPPAVGQVWAFPSGEYMITAVYTYKGVATRAFAGNDEYVTDDNVLEGEKPWPPEGALVYGPGSPWALVERGDE